MKAKFKGLLILLALLFFCAPLVRADETAWKERARAGGLSEEDISALEKNRILITNDAYKQIFSAYICDRDHFFIPFITSDSLLNAYHVLYEESIFRLESAMASKLPLILRLILKNLDGADAELTGRPELVAAAKKRAKLVTGIALKLIDDSFQFGNDELDGILKQETERIVKAEGIGFPEWLGERDESFSALDYTRYMPRGFYTRSEKLSRYFRAVSWLQSIPFRVNNDDELVSILMLGDCVKLGKIGNNPDQEELISFFRAYSAFLGVIDDWDLTTAKMFVQYGSRKEIKNGDLSSIREKLAEKAKGLGEASLINDKIRLVDNDSTNASELNFRILSAYRTPSAILFQRTTDSRKFNRPYPDGLEVAFALGSDFARDHLKDAKKEELLETIHSHEPFFNEGNSLYFQYLNALKALVDEPEPDAPDFMKNQAWKAKSGNTVLAGWTQLRHTWVLQAKQNDVVFGSCRGPQEFVEPEPEFYSRMADLAESTRELLEKSGAFETDYGQLADRLKMGAALIDGVTNFYEFKDKLCELPEKDRLDLDVVGYLMYDRNRNIEEWSVEFIEEQKRWLESIIPDVRAGRIKNYPEIREMVERDPFDLDDLWGKLAETSRHLELIAHKHLRHVDLNERDVKCMDDYGDTIAHLMLYAGNFYIPRDDAPKVVDVFANPAEGGYLHVGVARARKMYVLYPWKGETVLCEGAVMPYYEFVNSSRLTDESWKNMLDSDERPPIPEWLSPIVTSRGLKKPTVLLGD